MRGFGAWRTDVVVQVGEAGGGGLLAIWRNMGREEEGLTGSEGKLHPAEEALCERQQQQQQR